ncbi:MAG: hypothetical protein D6711_11410 [Chloroflexi bacterium]|nr:MAG: hypothetical protein D6711_11410 [Chloroflexota bacterium]
MRQLLIILPILLIFSLPLDSQTDSYIRADRLGITHISSGAVETPETRYQQALMLGAGWNRFPIYWQWAETAPGEWDWSRFDRQITNDLRFGLQINAILIGRPDFYADGERIQGMYEPIFADGTDIPAAGKALNPNNPWGVYVAQVVNRYKPGGELARSGNIPLGSGIRVWEIWNEPDFENFWRGTDRDYARLLKISYIVIKRVDPSAQVMFGGLLYPNGESNFLAQVLNIYANDPSAPENNWFMDLVAVHAYNDPWRSAWLTIYARQTMIAFGFNRPIWINESGVPVWDDYPGPTWQPESQRYATLEQQAWYYIQSAAYGWSEGADKIFFHQLYDDCGDQPAGTDFFPHNGSLCTGDNICYGDAHGLFRNLSTSQCFSHHPSPGTARPAARAFRLLAEVFGREPFENGDQVYVDDRFVTITFDRPRTNERITVMWNRRLEEATLTWQAVGQNGQLISLDGSTLIEPDAAGNYQITLLAAIPDVDRSSSDFGGVAIGGPPLILIEQRTSNIRPVEVDLESIEVEGTSPTVTPVPTSVAPRPTVNPADDITPPVAVVLALPETSPPDFTVTWEGQDNSGIASYLIWVRIDEGEWTPWLNTEATSAIFNGEPGRRYEFAAWAQDLAGNWSENINLQAQANTQVE